MLQMSGGLGNQMFLYALYLALKDMGREVCIDDYTMYKAIGRTDDCLERIFNLSYLHAERDEYIRLTDSSLAFKDRVRRKLTGRRGKLYTEKMPLPTRRVSLRCWMLIVSGIGRANGILSG